MVLWEERATIRFVLARNASLYGFGDHCHEVLGNLGGRLSACVIGTIRLCRRRRQGWKVKRGKEAGVLSFEDVRCLVSK